MNGSPDTPQATYSGLDVLLRQTREGFLDGLEQIMLRQVDPVLERTKQMMLSSTEALVREQAEPLLAKLRQVLLEALSEAAQRQLEPVVIRIHDLALHVTEEIIQKHAAPLVAQMRTAFQESVDEVVKRQMRPILDRARECMHESVNIATQLVDVIVARLQLTVAQPTAQMVRAELPQYARWAGRRTLDVALAATLCCLAAIFLLIGGVLGLEEVGLRPFASYTIGGVAALVSGLVFLRLFNKAVPDEPTPGSKL
jgi:hypothetical protein